jgi:hypothetical protein
VADTRFTEVLENRSQTWSEYNCVVSFEYAPGVIDDLEVGRYTENRFEPALIEKLDHSFRAVACGRCMAAAKSDQAYSDSKGIDSLRR